MSDLDDVKIRIMNKVDLARLVEETISLERRSGKLFGLCPFHNEKSPSFTIYNDHYYCFGCKASGDAISYVRHTHGLGFVDALKYLAQKFGVDASELERNTKWQKSQNNTAEFYKLMAAAQKWMVSQLVNEPGQKSIQYLKSRGFTEEQIHEFGFSYAPGDFQSMIDALTKQGYTDKMMVDMSLARISSKSGRAFAFFRDRLMVPIRDNFGRIIAFGGRTMVDDPAKYVNSSETYIFDKSKTLFGFHFAKEGIRKAGHALIVEGYMDVLKLWSVGITNAVACMGTAVTSKQLSQLSQITRQVVLCFDGDTAGRKANLGTVSSALEVPRVSVSVVTLPEGDDPDSFVDRQGADAFKALLPQAEELLSFAIKSKISEHSGLSLPNVVKKELLPWLSKVHDSLQRSYLANQISQATGIGIHQINGELNSRLGTGLTKTSEPIVQPVEEVSPKLTAPLKSHQFEMFGHLYYHVLTEEDWQRLDVWMEKHLELTGDWTQLCRDMKDAMLLRKSTPSADEKSLWPSVNSDRVQAVLARLDQMKEAFTGTDPLEAIEKIAREAQSRSRSQTIKSLKSQLSQASAEDQIGLLKAIKDLTRSMEDPSQL